MPSRNETNVPTKAPDRRVERLGQEVLLYCAGTAQTVYLNETAALVWELCDGTRTVEQIENLLLGAYPEAAGRIPTEVAQALRKLDESGALRLGS